MKISILCSAEHHPVNKWLKKWITENRTNHEITLCRKKEQLNGGDLLFLISCNEIIDKETRDMFHTSLVIHASDLPKGRGWSPHIWSILNGAKEIVVTLLEAEDKVDIGNIWKKQVLKIPPDALYHEINESLFDTELQLMNYAVKNFYTTDSTPQDINIEPSYYLCRTPKDSELDPDKTISEQFDLIRICDPERYPAFFKLHGHIYTISIEKKNIDEEQDHNR